MLRKPNLRSFRILGVPIFPFRPSRSLSMTTLGGDDDFKKVTESASKKVLYFTASWCPPCKKIGPVFQKKSTEYSGR